jgi:hypothetical protein
MKLPIKNEENEVKWDGWTCYKCLGHEIGYPKRADNGATLLCNKCWEELNHVTEKNHE